MLNAVTGKPSYYTITSQSTKYPGYLVTMSSTLSGPCNEPAPSVDMYLDTAGNGVTQQFLVGVPPPPPPPPAATVTVHAATPDHKMNPWFMGCHSDPGYTQEPRGWYAQLVYGESFEQGTMSVFAWNDVSQSTANAMVTLDDQVGACTCAGSMDDFIATHSTRSANIVGRLPVPNPNPNPPPPCRAIVACLP